MATTPTTEDAAETYRGLVLAIYFCAYIYAFVRSNRRWMTLLWIVLAAVAALLSVMATGYVTELVTKNEFAEMTVAELFTIPSLIVPAIVGVIHSRRTRRKPA